MTVQTRVYAYLSSRPGHKATFNEIERATLSARPSVKSALLTLVESGEVKRHLPKASGLTYWSVPEDTRPETRPLREMKYCGAIFTPPKSAL